ncbi:hypothetical protein OG948_02725 [Embleya sp. NBC_00888]|nr:hypothetical protein OG948_02725 [Embleya sp. NBC_00888]
MTFAPLRLPPADNLGRTVVPHRPGVQASDQPGVGTGGMERVV